MKPSWAHKSDESRDEQVYWPANFRILKFVFQTNFSRFPLFFLTIVTFQLVWCAVWLPVHAGPPMCTISALHLCDLPWVRNLLHVHATAKEQERMKVKWRMSTWLSVYNLLEKWQSVCVVKGGWASHVCKPQAQQTPMTLGPTSFSWLVCSWRLAWEGEAKLVPVDPIWEFLFTILYDSGKIERLKINS